MGSAYFELVNEDEEPVVSFSTLFFYLHTYNVIVYKKCPPKNQREYKETEELPPKEEITGPEEINLPGGASLVDPPS